MNKIYIKVVGFILVFFAIMFIISQKSYETINLILFGEVTKGEIISINHHENKYYLIVNYKINSEHYIIEQKFYEVLSEHSETDQVKVMYDGNSPQNSLLIWSEIFISHVFGSLFFSVLFLFGVLMIYKSNKFYYFIQKYGEGGLPNI